MARLDWNQRERKLLLAVRDLEERPDDDDLSTGELAEVTGLELNDAGHGVQALVEARYLNGTPLPGPAHKFTAYVGLRLTERGRRAVRQWPVPGGQLVDLSSLLPDSLRENAATDTLAAMGAVTAAMQSVQPHLAGVQKIVEQMAPLRESLARSAAAFAAASAAHGPTMAAAQILGAQVARHAVDVAGVLDGVASEFNPSTPDDGTAISLTWQHADEPDAPTPEDFYSLQREILFRLDDLEQGRDPWDLDRLIQLLVLLLALLAYLKPPG